jgi:hypothetical protein
LSKELSANASNTLRRFPTNVKPGFRLPYAVRVVKQMPAGKAAKAVVLRELKEEN